MPKRKPLHRKPSHAEIFESDRVSRTKLNKFTQNVEDNRANLANNPEELQSQVKSLDGLLKDCSSTDAAVNNTKALTMLTGINKDAVVRMKREGVEKYKTEDLMANITKKFPCQDEYEDDNIDFVALGRCFRKHLRQAPGLCFMNGPIATEYVRKEKVARQKRSKSKIDDSSQAVRPDDGLDAEAAKTNSADRAKQLVKFLPKEDDPMGYFQYVVNPESFTETVENIFDTSFLVKEGMCCVEVDPKLGYPVIYQRDKPKTKDFGVSVFPSEMVMSFSRAEYVRVIKAFGITESVLPMRYKPKKNGRQQKKR